MRNLSLLLALLLLPVLGIAATAQASFLPLTDQVRPLVEEEDTEAEEAEGELEFDEEVCVTEEEKEEEFCEEEEGEEGAKGKRNDECLLQSAKASLTANPGKQRLRLTVHYKTLQPATVSVEASLQSSKGAVRLGTDHARFRRSGVYRDTYGLAEKQMKKVAAARGFSVELHVVNAPASCRIELTGPSRLARR
jgi:hypothetical protein